MDLKSAWTGINVPDLWDGVINEGNRESFSTLIFYVQRVIWSRTLELELADRFGFKAGDQRRSVI